MSESEAVATLADSDRPEGSPCSNAIKGTKSDATVDSADRLNHSSRPFPVMDPKHSCWLSVGLSVRMQEWTIIPIPCIHSVSASASTSASASASSIQQKQEEQLTIQGSLTLSRQTGIHTLPVNARSGSRKRPSQ